MPANETLLLAARVGVRQAGAVLAHVARPAAFCWMRCSRTHGVMPEQAAFGFLAGRSSR